jgi:hypothetical protein
MNTEITSALVLVVVTVLVGAAGFIKVWFDRLTTKLQENTKISTEARDASNGRLSRKEEENAQLRQRLQAMQSRAEALSDIVMYIRSRPEAAELLTAYSDRRRVRVYDEGLDRLIADAHGQVEAHNAVEAPGSKAKDDAHE